MRITEESMKQASGELPAENQDVKEPEEPHLTEREKLQTMNFRDKLWYIWNYYRFHMIAAVLAIIVAVNVGTVIYHSTFHTALHCMIINSRDEEGLNSEPLEKDFASWAGLGKKEEIVSESTFLSFGDDVSEYIYASMAKISALVAAKDLDIMICDNETLDHYSSMDGFLDLETILPEEILDAEKDRLYYTENGDGVRHAYAIDISGTSFADDSNIQLSPALFGIVSNSTRTDTALSLLQYIWESSTH